MSKNYPILCNTSSLSKQHVGFKESPVETSSYAVLLLRLSSLCIKLSFAIGLRNQLVSLLSRPVPCIPEGRGPLTEVVHIVAHRPDAKFPHIIFHFVFRGADTMHDVHLENAIVVGGDDGVYVLPSYTEPPSM